jgi:hypothetical protein
MDVLSKFRGLAVRRARGPTGRSTRQVRMFVLFSLDQMGFTRTTESRPHLSRGVGGLGSAKVSFCGGQRPKKGPFRHKRHEFKEILEESKNWQTQEFESPLLQAKERLSRYGVREPPTTNTAHQMFVVNTKRGRSIHSEVSL